MKVVLRHKATGRYYRSAGQWVRRADNALAFKDVDTAREFCRAHRLGEAQPVHRLAAYLMPLLHRTRRSMWESGPAYRGNSWYLEQNDKFLRN